MSTQLPAASAAAARRVTGSCRDFTLDWVKFRVVCRCNLEIGLESDTQVGIDNISFRIKTTFRYLYFFGSSNSVCHFSYSCIDFLIFFFFSLINFNNCLIKSHKPDLFSLINKLARNLREKLKRSLR